MITLLPDVVEIVCMCCMCYDVRGDWLTFQCLFHSPFTDLVISLLFSETGPVGS